MADCHSGFTLFSLQNICVATTRFHPLEEKLGPEFFPEMLRCVTLHIEESHLVLDVGRSMYPPEALQSKGWQNETRSCWRFVNSGWEWFLFYPVLSASDVPFHFPLLQAAPFAYICTHHTKHSESHKNYFASWPMTHCSFLCVDLLVYLKNKIKKYNCIHKNDSKIGIIYNFLQK